MSFTALIISFFLLFSCGGDDPEIEIPGGGDDDNTESTTGIDKFSESNIYSINTELVSDYALQSFSLDSDGSIWYLQSASGDRKHELNLVKAKPNKSTTVLEAKTDYMRLAYFGHGTNADVEEDGSDRYLWLGAYGSCNSKGQYWTERLIGRVKYVKGKTVKTDECQEYYYIGDYTDMHPAIDVDNDILTVNYADPGNSNYRCFVIYRLSEAKKAPMGTFAIKCTDGFKTNNPASTNPIVENMYCRDLTKLTPVARMKFLKQGYGGGGATYYDWQGYDVYKDRLYYFEGQSNYNLTGSFYEGSSYAYVTIFDFDGNIVEERTQVAFVSDKDKIAQIGVSVFGTMEAEGIKVYKDKLYLGFTARGIQDVNTKHYQNIFVFDKSKK